MKRELDISLVEWRTLALLEARQPVRLRDVAAESDSDKAQISRIVSSLVERGLVRRQVVAQDARSAHLSLTPAGTEMAEKLSAIALDGDRVLRAACDEASIESMLATLLVLRKKAIELHDAEELAHTPSRVRMPVNAAGGVPAG